MDKKSNRYNHFGLERTCNQGVLRTLTRAPELEAPLVRYSLRILSDRNIFNHSEKVFRQMI